MRSGAGPHRRRACKTPHPPARPHPRPPNLRQPARCKPLRCGGPASHARLQPSPRRLHPSPNRTHLVFLESYHLMWVLALQPHATARWASPSRARLTAFSVSVCTMRVRFKPFTDGRGRSIRVLAVKFTTNTRSTRQPRVPHESSVVSPSSPTVSQPRALTGVPHS